MSIAFAVAGPVPTPLPSEPASRGSALGRALFTVRGWLYIPFALFSLGLELPLGPQASAR